MRWCRGPFCLAEVAQPGQIRISYIRCSVLVTYQTATTSDPLTGDPHGWCGWNLRGIGVSGRGDRLFISLQRFASKSSSDPGDLERMEEMLSNSTASVEQENMVEYAEAGGMNSLAGAASAYLRSAMHQPVGWMEWGQAAFDRASREDKPILLDIGAVWCHWCHVMDRESYEDEATAQIINQHFVAVKVDRDERPDVDTRYQAAVSAISGQGGWPLTAFLTPDGKPYFGGTYIPREERYG